MEAIIIVYLIATFTGGAIVGSWSNHNIAAKEVANISQLELRRDELTQRFNDPACEIVCREATWREREKIEKKIQRYERKYAAKGSRALAMQIEANP